MPQEETEAKRLPWVGVEYDPITRGVAELMAVSEPTYDGSRGLIVTQVYPGSPAAKIGLQEGDVLLSVRKTSGPGPDAPPVDLADRDEGMFPGFPFGFDGEAAPAPWTTRSSALVRMLQSWGTGTSFELEVLRDGKVVKHALQVEIDRSCYLAGNLRSAGPGFDRAARLIDQLAFGLGEALGAPNSIAAE